MAKEVKLKVSVDSKDVEKADKSLSKLEESAKKAGKNGTADLENMAEGFGSMSKAAGIAGTVVGTALVAIGAAAITATREIFNLTKAYSEFATQVQRTQTATALSAESISALKFQSQKLGLDFKTVVDGVANFNKIIADAEKGSKKATTTLEQFGIKSKTAALDTDAAFKQAIKSIVKLPEGLQQITAAQDLLGSSGKELLVFLKDFDGDLDELTERAAEYGFVLDDQAIKASKEFSDALKDNELQVEGLKIEIGRQFLPVLNDFFSSFNYWLKDNRENIKSWIGDISFAIQAFIIGLRLIKAAYNDVSDFLQFNEWTGKNIGNLRKDIIESKATKDARNAGIDSSPFRSGSQIKNFLGIKDGKSYLSDVDSAKKQAEKLRKERERLARSELSAQIDIYSSQLKEIEKLYAESFSKIGETLTDTGDISGFKNSFQELKTWYAEQINELIPLWQNLVEKQTLSEKKGHFQKVEIYEQTQRRINELTDATFDKEDKAIELIKNIRKKKSDEEIAVLKQNAEIESQIARMRKEEMFAELDSRENSSVRLAELFQNKIALGNQEIGIIKDLATIERDIFVTNQNRKIELLNVEVDVRRKIAEIVKNTAQSKDANIALEQAKSALKITEKINEIELFKFDQKQKTDLELIEQKNIPQVLKERIALQDQILNLENQIATVGENAAERYKIAWLDAILEVKDANIRAVESQIRSQVRLADMMTVHTEQIRANVLEHLASQKSLTEAIGDGIIEVYERISQKSDEFIDNTIGKIPGLGEIAKVFARSTLTKITTGLLDNILPGLGSELTETKNPIARPIVDKIKESNKMLKNIDQNIARATGGQSAGLGSIGGILGAITGGGFGGGGSSNSGGHGHANGQNGAIDLGQILSGGGAGGTGSRNGNIFANLKNIFSTKEGGIFAPVDGNGALGIAGGIGGLANIAGGLIGGKAGSVISSVGSGISTGAALGSIIPGVGTVIGAIVGGAIGFFASIFGSPKRKRDKNEKMPALEQGFIDAIKQLRDLAKNKNAILADPFGSIKQAEDIRDEIKRGFGIQFESKKYRKIAQQKISAKTSEANTIVEEIKGFAEKAKAANETDKRLVAQFAGGVFMDAAFKNQYLGFKRRNGLLPGVYSQGDVLPSLLAGNEMVLNPSQQTNVIKNAGNVDVFRGAGIPGYADGKSPSFRSFDKPVFNVSNRENKQPIIIEIHQVNNGMVESDIETVIDKRIDAPEIQVKIVKNSAKVKSRLGRG